MAVAVVAAGGENKQQTKRRTNIFLSISSAKQTGINNCYRPIKFHKYFEEKNMRWLNKNSEKSWKAEKRLQNFSSLFYVASVCLSNTVWKLLSIILRYAIGHSFYPHTIKTSIRDQIQVFFTHKISSKTFYAERMWYHHHHHVAKTEKTRRSEERKKRVPFIKKIIKKVLLFAELMFILVKLLQLSQHLDHIHSVCFCEIRVFHF